MNLNKRCGAKIEAQIQLQKRTWEDSRAMITPIKNLWIVLETNLPKGKWFHITDIYATIENNFKDFTTDDFKVVTPTNNEPTWHRNVRNALQTHKKTGEILYDGNAHYQLPTSTSYFLIGSKYDDNNDFDMFPSMEKYNVVCTGFAWNYDLQNLYQKSEDEIVKFLKSKKEEPKSYNALRQFLQLKIGDVVAVKSTGSPKAGKAFLEIVAYAVVVERDGIVYWHDTEHFGHCINVQFISTGLKRQYDLGGYGRTIHRIKNKELINELFNDYKNASSSSVRQKIKRRKRKAATDKNILGQKRKGSDGYVTNSRHNQIQQLFKEHLETTFGKDKVQIEENNVDIKLFQQDSITFYEVKPYSFAEDCIRSGLGQLLSYIFFDTDKREKIIKIVGPYPPDKDEQDFIDFLKRTLIIPFEYECFNID